MDPVTQGLLGAAAAQALFAERLGRRAWLIGAVGGVLPDADVFIRSEVDPLVAIEYHRGFTHALAFIPVGGALAGAPFLLRKRNRDAWRPVLAAAVVGYATHGLLDACTTYGTQLLWPFSSLRVAWNCVSIVDPIFTLILLVGVVWAARVRRRTPALVALGLCLLYLGLGVVQRERALAAQERIAAARLHAPERQAAFPTIGNLLVWRSLYEADGRLYADRIRVPPFGAPRWTPGTDVEALALSELAPEARADPRVARDFRRFAWFSGGWVARAPDRPEVIGDARYSLRTNAFEPIWGVRFDPGAAHPTQWVDRTRDRELSLEALWHEITGEDPAYRPLPTGAVGAQAPR